jgi:DNA-binding protein HU-beta
MTKAEFIDEIKNRRDINLTRSQTEAVVNAMFEVLSQTIRRHKKFTMPGFGVFVVRTRKARMGRDPRNQQPIQLKPSKTVAFRPSPKLKDSL